MTIHSSSKVREISAGCRLLKYTAFAGSKKEAWKFPDVVTCPHEFVAMSSAQGYSQVTGRAQAVIVHVECGTQNIGGAFHNGFKGRIPTLVFAGSSPYTQEGELRGTRGEFIQWIQDVHDQRGIVRGFTKYSVELKTGKNIKQMVYRAMQFATSPPYGPVYLVGPREVMEEEVKPMKLDRALWNAIEASGLSPKALKQVVAALAGAKHPLVITGYLGKDREAPAELVKLSEKLGLMVHETCPAAVNFPTSHWGYQSVWYGGPAPVLTEADVILIIDADVPWIPVTCQPNADAQVFHFDVDPLKETMPVWYIQCHHRYTVNGKVALEQINEALSSKTLDGKAIDARIATLKQRHAKRLATLAKAAEPRSDGVITPAFVAATVRKHLPKGSVLMNESVSNLVPVIDHFAADEPGTMFMGSGNLGWGIACSPGASLALKKMKPAGSDAILLNIVGDGSFMFGVPTSVYWVARRYDAPFLTVILNNTGWLSPKLSARAVQRDGLASAASGADLNLSFDPAPDYSMIAAASGAWTAKIDKVSDVESKVAEAIKIVQSGRCALLDIILPSI